MKVYHYTPITNVSTILQTGYLLPQENPHFPSGELTQFNVPREFTRSGISALFSPQPPEWLRDEGIARRALQALQYKIGQDVILLEIETNTVPTFVLDAAYLSTLRDMHKYYGDKIGHFVPSRYLLPEEVLFPQGRDHDYTDEEIQLLRETREQLQARRFLESAIPIDAYDQARDDYQVPEIFMASTSVIPLQGRVLIHTEQPLLENYLVQLTDAAQRDQVLQEIANLALYAAEVGQPGLGIWYRNYLKLPTENGLAQKQKER